MRFRSAATALALLAFAACGPLASIQGDAAPGDSASADAAPEASPYALSVF